MTFIEAVKKCLSKENYFNFNGRARRSEFWYFYLFAVIVGWVCSYINGVLGTIVGLILLLPSLGVGARRLHDTTRSAWNLLWHILPVIGTIILIIFYIQDSKPANKYGDSPK
ncbi:MAG: DUF805 domain-containing protein [Prevotellaceae bacterium]|nr:DUF805 domain-containing protein [Prevotellaceae bacterium]